LLSRPELPELEELELDDLDLVELPAPIWELKMHYYSKSELENLQRVHSQ
jgi:hypothetical protein